MAEAFPAKTQPSPPHLGKVGKAVPGWHPGSSQSSWRRGRTKNRLGAQVRARISPAEGNQVRQSPKVTRDVHGGKTGPREQVSPQIKGIHSQRGARLQLNWRLKLV